MHRLKSPHHPPGTYVLAQQQAQACWLFGMERFNTGEKQVTMKRTCTTAPPAHTSAVQRPWKHPEWALLIKVSTDTVNESPARSGWKQPASACQTFCTTTTFCFQTFFPSLLPPTHTRTDTSALRHPPCLVLMPESTVWLLPSDFHISITAGRVTVIPYVATPFQQQQGDRNRESQLFLPRSGVWWACL